MRFGIAWLKQHLDTCPEDDATLAECLTMAGLEVDEIQPAKLVKGIIVGRIVEVNEHPNADRLKLCRVDIGEDDTTEVVCGAPNACAGFVAPFAPVGARLDTIKIKKTRIRGTVSNGMLCSPAELGLGDQADGLLELAPDSRPGAPLSDYIPLDNSVIKLDLTPNRSDCLSIRGIAREIAAGQGVRPTFEKPVAWKEKHRDIADIHIRDKVACPRYLTCIIKDIEPGVKTPLSIKTRLWHCGAHSIHPVVDVLNMLMFEFGQPMHAFDFENIKGGLEVRHARAGEKLSAIGNEIIQPTGETLVIADENGPVALAGILGGAHSAVCADTRTVLLESAFFHPHAIMGRARALRLHTESSHRFERGVDYNLPIEAMQRAVALISEIYPNAKAGPLVDKTEQNCLPASIEITASADEINESLGVSVGAKQLQTWFELSGCKTRLNGATLTCTPPSWRFDLNCAADLIEEAGRFYGYDNIPNRTTTKTVHPERLPDTTPVDRLSDRLCVLGYREVITVSFTDPAISEVFSDAKPAPINNPIAPELAAMRTSMLPNLAQVLRYNLNRGQDAVRIFECGKVYTCEGDKENRVAGLIYGRAMPEQWGTPSRQCDFYDIKGDVETLLNGCGKITFERSGSKGLHAGQAARILLDGRHIGDLGALSPEAERVLDLPSHVFVFDLCPDLLPPGKTPLYKDISKYPSVRNDISMVVPVSVTGGEITEKILSLNIKDLQKVLIFDMFQGGNLGAGEKSISLCLIYRSTNETLSNDTVAGQTQHIIRILSETFNAGIRT